MHKLVKDDYQAHLRLTWLRIYALNLDDATLDWAKRNLPEDYDTVTSGLPDRIEQLAETHGDWREFTGLCDAWLEILKRIVAARAVARATAN